MGERGNMPQTILLKSGVTAPLTLTENEPGLDKTPGAPKLWAGIGGVPTLLADPAHVANLEQRVTTIEAAPPGATYTFDIGLTNTAGSVNLDAATTTIIGGLLEAPADTKQYARKDNTWAEIVAGATITEPVGAGTWGRLATATWERSVAVAGDTMTGQLTVTDAPVLISGTTGATLSLSGGTATNTLIYGQKWGLNRWNVVLGDFSGETGANAGSNFGIGRFDDLGVYIDSPILINRATGIVDFAFNPTVNGVPIGGGATITEPVGPGTWGRLATGLWERSVALAGDTMTGDLHVEAPNGIAIAALPAANAGLYMTRQAGFNASVFASTDALRRWSVVFADDSAETGANTGSNFIVNRYNDAGVSIDTPLIISRATGEITLRSGLHIESAVDWSTLDMVAAASQGVQIASYTGAFLRWTMLLAQPAGEIGGNVGSDFTLSRFDDAGTFIDSPLTIIRSTGIVDFERTPTVNGVPIGGGTGFPDAPADGITYGRLNLAWNPVLPITGGVLTGETHAPMLVVTNTAASSNIDLRRPSGQSAILGGMTTNLLRWQLVMATSIAETGANAGSDFAIIRYDDLGTSIDTPLAINRASGIVDFARTPTVLGVPIAAGDFVLKSGDSMTGTLNVANGRILSSSSSNPAFTMHNPGVIASGFWMDANTGAIWWGAMDGAGTALAGWGLFNNNGVITANNGVIFGAGTGFKSSSIGSHYITEYSPNYWDGWEVATGTRSWTSNGVTHTTLDVGGNLWTAAHISSNTIGTAGTITSGGWIMNNEGRYFVAGNTAYYMGRHSWDGLWAIVDNNITLFYINPATKDTTLAGQVYVNAACRFTPGRNANIWGLFDQGAWCESFEGSNGQMHQLGINGWMAGMAYNTPHLSVGGGAMFVESVGNVVFAGACYATAYPGPSDITLKQNVVEWKKGLAEIMQINPVEYEFTEASQFDVPEKEGDARRKHYGVNAQDIISVLPEAVSVFKRDTTSIPPWPTDTDEEKIAKKDNAVFSELLAVESSTILYAAVNAIKELATRVAALEGAR